MHLTNLISTTLVMAMTASAVPHAHFHKSHSHGAVRSRDSTSTFNIHVTNKCSDSMTVGLFSDPNGVGMTSMSPISVLGEGDKAIICAGFYDVGMRLSGHADWTDQYEAQSLFEFGYSAYMGLEGTAYNLSLMNSTDFGLSVHPMGNGQGSGGCESKCCTSPDNCPLSQGWTNADQTADSNPADTTCMHGMMDFKVVLCPSS